MKFKLSAYTIWEQGPRPRQEDSIFPAHNSTTPDDRLFLVCDGMGGHSAGDVASSTVCAALSSSIIASCDAEGEFTDEKFEAALSAAYDALDSKDDGSPKKMGTTLTFLKLHKAGCTIAHIGDSRVYHLRPGADAASTEIVHQTQDHSLVNDLVRIGELTPEEAKTSKQRNVITRAMQPNMERRSRADLAHTSDIRKGDYFLLCSDGILEQMEDDNLKFIFSDKGGDAQHKIEMLIKVTAENRDNHSALLVHITDVEPEADDVPIAYEPPKGPRRRAAVATMEVEEVEVPTPSVAPVDDHGEPEDDGHDDESPLALAKRYMLPALAVVVVCLTIFFIYKSFSADDKEEAPKSTTENVAEQGDAEAQDSLGNCYYNGLGVDQDYTEAVKWCRKAAEQGDADAQYNLGLCYKYGRGVDQNYAEAVQWYRKAAEQGYAKAQHNLGLCYEFGEGVDQNSTEAVKWWSKAAEQGYAKAQYILGVCYYLGHGVAQDYAEAVKWWSKAAELGHAEAQYYLDCCYDNGEGVDQNDAEVAKWYRKAAEQGDADTIEALRLLEEI